MERCLDKYHTRAIRWGDISPVKPGECTWCCLTVISTLFQCVYNTRSPEKVQIFQSNGKAKDSYPTYLTFLENPLLRALCAQLLNVLEHVKDDVLYVHWNERKRTKEVYSNLYTWSLTYIGLINGFQYARNLCEHHQNVYTGT